jgi:lipid II isoglutaminyl synthase (glutamine-hydrolysing)
VSMVRGRTPANPVRMVPNLGSRCVVAGEDQLDTGHKRKRRPSVAKIGERAAGRASTRRGRLDRARVIAAVVAGRAAGASARRLRLGAGTSLSGLVASRLDPNIVAHLGSQLQHGSALVTGTNGKTTTSAMLAYILRDAGLRVWRNREGSNLLRGITAALVIRAEPNGHLRRHGDAAAVFEVDEAWFGRVLAELQPRVVAITNLFRDQLDRYGEVDTVAERWREVLAHAPAGTALALNADDPAVAALGDSATGPVVYFGVEDALGALGQPREAGSEVIDTRTCPRCRAPLTYSRRFYSHIGHWACDACGFARPMPEIRARSVASAGLDEMHLRLETRDGTADATLTLPGLYNAYNALAAAAAAHLMGAGVEAMRRGLERFTPAFGRAERIQVDSREVRLMLAKNPTGVNEVLRALALASQASGETVRRHLFLLLNDNLADGQDVSWIWDADFERVPALARSVVVGGIRAADLAVRLKYAGLPMSPASGSATEWIASDSTAPDESAPAIPVTVEPSLAHALDAALANVPAGETLYVIPTYTAMLAVRTELERRGYAPHYWEIADS